MLAVRRDWLRDESGATAVVFTVLIISVVCFLGATVDIGYWRVKYDRLQAATDAAATAAVIRLMEVSGEAAEAEAEDYMARFLGEKVKVSVVVSPGEPSVTVTATQQAQRFFSVFMADRNATISVRSKAVADPPGKRLCVLTMDEMATQGLHMHGDANLIAPNCVIWSNSAKNTSVKLEKNISASTGTICTVGGVINTSKGDVSPPPQDNCPPLPDPYAGLTMEVPEDCDFTKFTSSAPVVNIEPGTYCDGIAISSETVIAAPGLYHIKGGMVAISGTSIVSFEGATLYMSGKGVGLNVKGDSELRLTAPESGPTEGIAVALDPEAEPAKESKFAGASVVFISGVVHAPTQKITISGETSGVADLENALLIASEVEFDGAAEWRWIATDKLPPAVERANARLVQ